ncbi:chemotaxis protein CheD [Rhodobacter capsulatus]|uniref:Probable chemoreceptor glutamine deamidase CheD n=1 Tax=Rhodobacter capsulatus TaxID=1061 RepID=A0A1G7HCI2_RHOCA|nr:chemotaxis protein CheD [Rhodobacter capsulatus]WER07721.1 chemotaxis protein CheD [Rhodobacter capsulatus]SDE98014.1 chemotaxis protein CheD [Rhodobacter capsulatus]
MAGHHKTLHIAQGEFITAKGAEASISTILGSCVATCLYDEGGQVGGMNHFLLPDGAGASLNSARFGVNAMELLINALIKDGANRKRLKAKVFGGGRMIAGLTDVGQKNAEFVLDFLRREGIECTGQSLGGTQARRVEFWPGTGRARQRLLGETRVVETPPVPAAGNGVELF